MASRSTESELAELSERVARLEARVEALAGSAEPPVIPRLAGTAGSPSCAPVRPRSTPVAGVVERGARPGSTVWVAAVGAGIFLLGAIYGLLVSIQRGWISPAMRVGLGLVAGMAFVGAAARVLRTNRGVGIALFAAGAGTWTFSLYYAVEGARLFPAAVGLMGCAVAVIAGGWVAARERAEGALVVSVLTGLVAPLAFGILRGGLDGLLVYLLVLTGAQLAVPYFAGAAAGWRVARLVGLAGPWLVALLGAHEARRTASGLSLGWLAVLAAAGLALAWLPRARERPSVPGWGTLLSLAGFSWVAWPLWTQSGFEPEGFSVVLAAQGAAALALVGPTRRRLGGPVQDRTLLVLACGYGLLALPVAWDWEWVTLAWGLAALGLAWLARRKGLAEPAGTESVLLPAVLAAAAATTAWLVLALDQGVSAPIFLNRVFLGGACTAGAWAMLLAASGSARSLAFAGLQFVAVNAVAWEFARGIPPVHGPEATLAVGALLATLTYAVAGAWQWLCGVAALGGSAGRALRGAGYTWLAVAVGKLFWHDLAGRDLVFKAVAALGVGAIFIVAALWANHRRKAPDGDINTQPGKAGTTD